MAANVEVGGQSRAAIGLAGLVLLAFWMLAAGCARPVAGAEEGDALAGRRVDVLGRSSGDLFERRGGGGGEPPYADYEPERSPSPFRCARQPRGHASCAACFQIARDAHALLAALRLDALGLEPGPERSPVSPETAGPRAAWIAREMGKRISDRRDTCYDVSGPTMDNAALSLQVALALYGADWAPAEREAVFAVIRDGAFNPVPSSPDSEFGIMGNQTLPTVLARVVGGEAMCDAKVWTEGVRQLNAGFRETYTDGPAEWRAVHYVYHTLSDLVLARAALDPRTRAHEQVEALWQLYALISAHGYLPGGGVVAPIVRGRGGDWAHGETLYRAYGGWLMALFGEPEPARRSWSQVARSLFSYGELGVGVAPEPHPLVRSIAMEKGEGDRVWARARHNDRHLRRVPRHYVDPGEGPVMPAQIHVYGDQASMGVLHGYNTSNNEHVPFGVFARCPECPQGWYVATAYAPVVCDSDGECRRDRHPDEYVPGQPMGGIDADPYDARGTGPDYEWFLDEEVLLSTWVPEGYPPHPRRAFPEVVAELPHASEHGGAQHLPDDGSGWNAVAVPAGGDRTTYIGVWMAAEKGVEADDPRSREEFHFPRTRRLRGKGRTGMAVVIGTQERFCSLEAFREALPQPRFRPDGPGGWPSLTLRYGGRTLELRHDPVGARPENERRYVDGVEQPSLARHAVLESRHCRWQDDVLTCAKGTHPELRIDFGELWLDTRAGERLPEACPWRAETD